MQLADIKKLAQTARIDMNDEEAEGLSRDLDAALTYIDQINKAELPDGDVFVPEHRNAVREDIPTNTSGQYTDAMLAQAVASQDGFVKVKKVL